MDSKKLGGKSQSQQISEIWKFLDHLAQNDPKKYNKFIKETLDDGEKHGLGPPEHFFSIKTHKVPRVIPLRDFYINACKWKQIPPPKSENSSIPMTASELREELIDDRLCYTFDVAINPDTLEECVKKEDEKKMLIELLIRYTEQLTRIRLSSTEYKIFENEYKGNKDNLLDMMCPDALKTAAKDSKHGLSDQGLLHQLKKLDIDTNKELNSDETVNVKLQMPNDEQLLKNDIVLPTQMDKDNNEFLKEADKSVLIDNKDDELKAEFGNKETFNPDEGLMAPKFTETEEMKNGERFLVVKVDLPGVATMNDCDVDISDDSVEILVPGKYKLAHKLSRKIDEDNTDAVFVRRASILILKMKYL